MRKSDKRLVSKTVWLILLSGMAATAAAVSLGQDFQLINCQEEDYGCRAFRKLKAPEVFRPSSSSIDEDIISRFIEHQKHFIQLMKRTEGLDLRQIRITSPAVRFITYSLLDGFEIIAVHEKRHFQQAEKILGADGFPGKV
jgi:hypothetical protein